MSSTPSRLCFSARRSSRGGFTLVELLVVIGIIAILAGVALGPITHALKKGQENVAMQNTRTLALAEFQYAIDQNVYPDGSDAGAVAQDLVNGGYVSDPKNFQCPADTKVSSPAVANGTITMTQANVSFNFAGANTSSGGNTTPSGFSSTASDLLPLVWSGGEGGATIPTTAGVGTAFTMANTGVYGKDGIAVAYKSNSAFFRAPQIPTAPTFPGAGKVEFVDQTFDPSGTTFVTRLGVWNQ